MLSLQQPSPLFHRLLLRRLTQKAPSKALDPFLCRFLLCRGTCSASYETLKLLFFPLPCSGYHNPTARCFHGMAEMRLMAPNPSCSRHTSIRCLLDPRTPVSMQSKSPCKLLASCRDVQLKGPLCCFCNPRCWMPSQPSITEAGGPWSLPWTLSS